LGLSSQQKKILFYCIKFLGIYCMLYYGSKAIIGLSVPGGGYYSPIIQRYFDYPSLLRKGILHVSGFMLNFLGYPSEILAPYKVRLINGRGVKIVYSCLGLGLFSFWIAFVLANTAGIKRRVQCMGWGVLAIFLINVTRVVLLVIVANHKASLLEGTDHHTVFNIAAYTLIFLMIFIYDRTDRKGVSVENKKLL